MTTTTQSGILTVACHVCGEPVRKGDGYIMGFSGGRQPLFEVKQITPSRP
jgi:hypothetical protein